MRQGKRKESRIKQVPGCSTFRDICGQGAVRPTTIRQQSGAGQAKYCEQLAAGSGALRGHTRTMSACAAPPALKKLPNLPLLGSSWPRPGVMVPFVSAHHFVRPRQLGRRRD
jgi:hypothetical protein